MRWASLFWTLVVLLVLRRSDGQETPTRFSIIGDFGDPSSPAEGVVATHLNSSNPEFIVALGDITYVSNIDLAVGPYYSQYIYPYKGKYGTGAPKGKNAFWPCIGNHDQTAIDLIEYLNYFKLPGNERYYDVVLGPVHLFSLNSNRDEEDGTSPDSVQGRWLQQRLRDSVSPHRMVIFHHPPYHSSDGHGQAVYMRWPFEEWGATVVMGGHVHVYERLFVHNLTYVVNGVGGRNNFHGFDAPVSGSLVRWVGFGYMNVVADQNTMNCTMLDLNGVKVLDTFTLSAFNRSSAQTSGFVKHTSVWSQNAFPLLLFALLCIF
jgi:tartrate-resistant acid phosphatase type 5